MTDEFSKNVPPALLEILTGKLVPLILAALNAKDDGGGGDGGDGGNNSGSPSKSGPI